MKKSRFCALQIWSKYGKWPFCPMRISSEYEKIAILRTANLVQVREMSILRTANFVYGKSPFCASFTQTKYDEKNFWEIDLTNEIATSI
eukprot:augustus_masked-scaffold_37-processed-gene-1.43-mRNA-1 protein AED:1.00 eAED:1.00 QI:0/-1/0/0/-1/1/1/0/88